MIFDILLIVVLVCAFLIGMKRGLLRTIWGLSALIASIVLASILHPIAIESFKSSPIGTGINNYIYEKIEESGAGETLDAVYSLPQGISQNIDQQAENIEATVQPIVDTVINIACAIFLFILIRIALAVLYNVLKLIFSFPVLKQTNKLAGGIIQTLIAFVAVYAVLAIAAVYGNKIPDDSYICKTMYENNILISVVAHT